MPVKSEAQCKQKRSKRLVLVEKDKALDLYIEVMAKFGHERTLKAKSKA